ncbi:metallophosphoesterase [Bacillus sp. 1NLA3E]|uniref:metallophosphoesterase n=1 Tax=Bacillus sp. 1NLA3E TaxID=666686 RepID=UPI000247EF40|nr:metallophosphoesterase [Bacillus sp. 1NLA3E]AGK52887.1 metallophosphoesterase [Bacillus sp. 1NLA3E]
MLKKVSRRFFLKRFLQFGMITLGSGTGIYYYARDIETRMLKITEHMIEHPHIPVGFDGCKIVQFSDTHLGFQYNLNQLEKLISKIDAIAPDIIFFTGDLMDAPNQYEHQSKITPLLSSLKAPLGKFCVYGNHDHGGYGSDIFQSIMSQSGFTILQNDYRAVKLLDGSLIYIIGLDDAMLGKPNLEQALADIPDYSYKILLSHAPDLADQALSYGIELQLSGHSHGGQIKIPFFGALVTPPFAEKYTEGFYEIKNQSQKLTLYVNRGIGTTRLPFRFLSHPELTIFQLAAKG